MIQYKINLTKEKLKKYSKGKERIKLDICNENDNIIEKKVISKSIRNKMVTRKRKRNDERIEEKQQEIKKLKKEDKIKRFMNELRLPIKDNREILMEELDKMVQDERIKNVKKLVEKYLDLRDENSKLEQTVRKEIYDEMIEFLIKKDEDKKAKKDKRKALKEKIEKETEENLLGNKKLLRYGYIIEDDELDRRFMEFEE
ncbi:hypothetical protein C1645_824680 [Glomus cerebriforme]|uniref:Uncharacterized protein n=1 Tax=Glomus cerebriforme TaxID=658196 RepID=A0A397SV23_9GLOM|nr:hypothetical protein C1645_824680 [Glomus cerebriforme]